MPYQQNFGEAYDQLLPTLGEAMVDVIKLFGGEDIYGVGGDFAANLIAALSDELTVLPSSNEMHAGFNACAQAEVTGMGFCLTTYMVGSLPCVSAAALAKTESLPVVFLSGAPGEQEVHQDAIHHTVHAASDWQTRYDNALDAFASMGITAERLQGKRHPGQPNIAGVRFLELVTQAWRTKQPVFIEIPRDLVFSKTQALALPTTPANLETDHLVYRGCELIAAQVAEKLNQASFPLIYIGDKLKHNAPLKSQLLSLCHQYNIPYATSWFAKGLFDEFDPLCLGCYNGAFSHPRSRRYIEQQMDYVLDIATSIYPQDSNTAFATGTHAIESFANKTLLKGSAPLEQDLLAIISHLAEQPLKHFTPELPMLPQAAPAPEARVDFHNIMPLLNHLQQQDPRPYIYLPEIGNSYFASYSLHTRASRLGRSWLTNPWYGAMGTSLPYARVVARQLQQRQLDEKTIVITGDGGFHFQLNELIHLMKEGTSVTIIYMRNNIFHLGKNGDAPIYHCNDPEFDVLALVRAYGGDGRRCETVGEFSDYFKGCINQASGIRLIEVPCIASEQYQCHEIRLLNLYIRAKNGDPDSIREWQQIADSAGQ